MTGAIVAGYALRVVRSIFQPATRNGLLLWLQITLNIGQFKRGGSLKASG
jgi:hypothetical protein